MINVINITISTTIITRTTMNVTASFQKGDVKVVFEVALIGLGVDDIVAVVVSVAMIKFGPLK